VPLTRLWTSHSTDIASMPNDPWSILVTSFMQEGLPVTVGIGTLCNYREVENSFIILAVDDKATFFNPKALPNNACGKFYDLLPEPFCLSISGSIDVCDGVIASFDEKIRERKEKREDKLLYPDDLRWAIKEARRFEYGKFLEEEMQGYLQMSFSDWLKEPNQEIKKKGLTIVRAARMCFPVLLIVGGFTAGHAIVMRSKGACITEMGTGPFCIGAGELEANNQLSRRSQNHHMCAARTLLHIDEAMEKARRKYPKYIGQPADYMVLRESGEMMRFRRQSSILQGWRKNFAKKDTLPMDTDANLQKEFEKELIPHIPRPIKR
jgi:hypothetical protein